MEKSVEDRQAAAVKLQFGPAHPHWLTFTTGLFAEAADRFLARTVSNRSRSQVRQRRAQTNSMPRTAKAAGTSQYQGQTYYFCSKGCKTKFDANPGQYVK